MWYQYSIADGIIQATNTMKVDDQVLAKIGRAQIEGEYIDITTHNIDISKKVPEIVHISGSRKKA